jgi:hypothetical protein
LLLTLAGRATACAASVAAVRMSGERMILVRQK